MSTMQKHVFSSLCSCKQPNLKGGTVSLVSCSAGLALTMLGFLGPWFLGPWALEVRSSHNIGWPIKIYKLCNRVNVLEVDEKAENLKRKF